MGDYPEDDYGQIVVGSYNCLKPDAKVGYKTPATMTLTKTPDIARGKKEKTIDAAWDLYVTKAQAEKEIPLADAYKRIKAELGVEQEQIKHVHTDWKERTYGFEEIQPFLTWSVLYDMYGPYAPAAAASYTALHSGGSGFVGNLVGVAPWVCGAAPFQGAISKTYVDEASVSVSSSTTEGWEFGLTAEAGIDFKGASVKRTASFRWSKTTTNTTTVSKSHSETTGVLGKDGKWTKLDVRACAGVYLGWYVYKVDKDKDEWGMYPMLAPVHAPGFTSPVAEHKLEAPASLYNEDDTRLLNAYRHAEEQHAEATLELANADGQATDEMRARLQTSGFELMILRHQVDTLTH
ncbi:hypothetical protein [Streptomyces sp. NPDC088748]|uniref:hypothetical protein n=1 Tax=Streptomyces sp. NPDC088748 TaxID=3365887 RepID=UPI00380E61C5